MLKSFITFIAIAVLFVIDVSSSIAQHSFNLTTAKPAKLVSGLGNVHHPVSTANPEAQKFFDQGLAYIYAFNHDEAVRSFERAAELDPDLAMAWWGKALSLGPNINLDVDSAKERAAYEAIQQALLLAPRAPENERDYIQALAKRYSTAPNVDLKKLAVDYKNGMNELVKEYPDDLDLATLYAEGMMDLRPWALWGLDGKPAEGTVEIIAVLESVLKRNPNHTGANHYYVHAVEASPTPERALVSAERLRHLHRLPDILSTCRHISSCEREIMKELFKQMNQVQTPMKNISKPLMHRAFIQCIMLIMCTSSPSLPLCRDDQVMQSKLLSV